MALYTKAELAKKTLAELKALAKEHGIEIEKGWKAADLREALADIEEPELEDELEDELEEELDEEELDEELLEEEEDDIEPEPAPKKKPATVKAKVAKAEKSGDTLAAKQVASILGTEPKTLRQFFRSPASTVEAVGSGGRYEFATEDIDQIKAEFDAWKAQHASRGAKRASGGKSTKVAEEVEEVEEIEELDLEDELDDELDDEELELED